MWLRYVLPNYWIQSRRGVLRRYEIQTPEYCDRQLGMVEQYTGSKGEVRWRTLDFRKNDWKSGFLTREAAAQDLILTCPAVIKRLEFYRAKREREQAPAESQQIK
jgi:hypothetical protein